MFDAMSRAARHAAAIGIAVLTLLPLGVVPLKAGTGGRTGVQKVHTWR